MNAATFILIALLKTSGEGGTIQLAYADLATCEAAGARLEAQFEAIPLFDPDGEPAAPPKAIWTCFEAPRVLP